MDQVKAGDLTAQQDKSRLIALLLIITGFTTSSIQFILLREAVILGGGSESSTGLFLWLWLMISSAGAFAGAGGKNKTGHYPALMRLLVAGLTLSLFCYPLINMVLVKTGEMPSFLKSFLILSVAVAPASFVSSYVFVGLRAIRQSNGSMSPGSSFGVETAGSAAAGLLSALGLTVYLPNFMYAFLILICAVTFLTFLLTKIKSVRYFTLLCCIALAVSVLILKPDTFIRGMMLRGVTVESSTDTPYGNITKGSYGGEKTIFYDHRPLFFSGDIAAAEEDIQYALLQREENDRVLIISGGLLKHLPQAQKFNVNELTYLEHDPGVIAAEGIKDTVAGNTLVNVIGDDPVKYFRHTYQRYNAIIQLVPSPVSLSVNRFYTYESFGEVKKHLLPGGVFLCTPLPQYNYSPQSLMGALSPIYNSLKKVFRYVVFIPGSRLYMIASDEPLSGEITRLTRERGIDNVYVNSSYLDDREIKQKGDLILSRIESGKTLNTNLRPVSAWMSDTLSLEMRGIKSSALIIIALLAVIPFLFLRRGGFLMFAASAALAGYGMTAIFLIQAAIGSMYLFSSVILALLMAGLAAGASSGDKTASRPLIPSVFVALLYSAGGLFSPLLLKTPPAVIVSALIAVLIAAGLLTGRVFRLLTLDTRSGATGYIYGSDLAGAALGYFVVSAILIPMTGVIATSIILSAFILLSVAIVTIVIKH